MAKSNLFTDIWGGWVGFWKEFAGSPPKTVATRNAQLAKPRTTKPVLPPPQKTVMVPKPPQKAAKAATRALKKRMKIERPVEVLERVDPPAPFPEQHIETPKERLARLERMDRQKKTRQDPRTKHRRQMLWMNPGTDALRMAHLAFENGLELPGWAKPVKDALTFDKHRLYFENLPMLDKEEKRVLVKKEYFDPKGFSTIGPIYDKFATTHANLTRADVRRILRSLETYQLNFRRRLPPKVMSRMNLKAPGTILLDTFFPSRLNGWRSDLAGVTTCMDAWSRYVQCYALESKSKKTVGKGIRAFLKRFASLGHLPKMILCDKGSELKDAGPAMERYRTKPGQQLVFHSQTGKPVNLVESTQAQIQRRMQVFATSGITDDYSAVLDDICSSINNQKRPERGNKTPLELLAMSKEERLEVNANKRFGVATPDERFQDLVPGMHVRVLMMTLKEQVTNKKKGFSEKWSRDVYIVKKKVALQGNPAAFRYFLHGDSLTYFRHELLKVPKEVDRQVYDLVTHRERVVADEDFGDAEWAP